MRRLPVRWLPVRLEKLLGLWRLRRLLLVLGLLPRVLTQNRWLTWVTGPGLARDPAHLSYLRHRDVNNASLRPPPLMRDRSRRDHDLKMLPLRW